MYCKNCGAELWDGSKFCTECGTKLLAEDNVTVKQSEETATQESKEETAKQSEETATQESQEQAKEQESRQKEEDEVELPQLDLQGVFDEEIPTFSENEKERILEGVPTVPENEGEKILEEISMVPENEEEKIGKEVSADSDNSYEEKIENEAPETESTLEAKGKNNGIFIGITVAAAFLFLLISAVLTGFFVSKYTDEKNAELKAAIQKELTTYLDFCDKAVDYKNQFKKFYLDDEKESILKEKLAQGENQIVSRVEETQLNAWIEGG